MGAARTAMPAKRSARTTPGTPDAFAAQIRSELAVRTGVVKDANIELV